MNPLILVAVLVWLGFGLCVVALLRKPRPRQDGCEPVSDIHGGTGPTDAIQTPPVMARAPLAAFSVFLLAAGVFVVLQTGLLSQGRERKHATFGGFSSSNRGFSFGKKKFLARQGQTVAVKYAYVQGHGDLLVEVRRSILLGAEWNMPVIWSQKASTPGEWTAQVPIPETGYYRLSIRQIPDGRGYDFTYDVSWKLQ